LAEVKKDGLTTTTSEETVMRIGGRWMFKLPWSSYTVSFPASLALKLNRYGPSHLAFVIVPLVCAFFIDLVNAVMIPFFLSSF